MELIEKYNKTTPYPIEDFSINISDEIDSNMGDRIAYLHFKEDKTESEIEELIILKYLRTINPLGFGCY